MREWKFPSHPSRFGGLYWGARLVHQEFPRHGLEQWRYHRGFPDNGADAEHKKGTSVTFSGHMVTVAGRKSRPHPTGRGRH